MQPKISVIVPIYNAVTYLSCCLDSILAQTFIDWELILVDDGSPDLCGVICDDYAKKDSRIRVIHKPNGGVSSARNSGLDVAKGEYICFIDADDKIDSRYLEAFVNAEKSDLVISGFKYNSGDKYTPGNAFYIGNDFVNRVPQIIRLQSIYVPWAKMFKRCIIENNKLRFDIKLRLSEDTTFVYYYLSFCNSVTLIDNDYYYYKDIFGGGKKYVLSYEEIDYLNYCNVASINAINKNIGTNIDTRYNGAKWHLLADAYSKYTDMDAWVMYSRYHNNVTKDEYFQRLSCNCSQTAINLLKEEFMNGHIKEGFLMMKDLHHFFTINYSQVSLRQFTDKWIYKMIYSGYFPFLYLLLPFMYPVNKLIRLFRN